MERRGRTKAALGGAVVLAAIAAGAGTAGAGHWDPCTIKGTKGNDVLRGGGGRETRKSEVN